MKFNLLHRLNQNGGLCVAACTSRKGDYGRSPRGREIRRDATELDVYGGRNEAAAADGDREQPRRCQQLFQPALPLQLNVSAASQSLANGALARNEGYVHLSLRLRCFELNFSRLCSFRFGQNEVQDTILERRFDPIAVYILGQCETRS